MEEVPAPETAQSCTEHRRCAEASAPDSELEDRDMATIITEDVCPDESSDDEAPPGPDVLPYVDEDNPRIILWLNADEWAKLPRQKSLVTSKQSPQEPLNEGTKPQVPLTNETKPQAAELLTQKTRSKPAKSQFCSDMTLVPKRTKFFALKPSGLVRMREADLAQHKQWQQIHSVIFGKIPGPRFVQRWDEETNADMIKNSKLIWQSDPPTLPRKAQEPVSVAVFCHVQGGLWCEVASTETPQKLFIVDPNF